MKQLYKAIYFTDYPADSSNQKSLTIAFSQRNADLYEHVKGLSSAELRHLLGTEQYSDLAKLADQEELPLSTYCVRQLRSSIVALKEKAAQLPLWDSASEIQIFDPITVTFKGGAKEPFVRWYPYLEGYSTQFVETILTKYAPEAKVVLDPFAGTGTTAFTASRLNKVAYFCEVNPVLQFIMEVKICVRRLDAKSRLRLAEALTKLYFRMDEAIHNSVSDHNLQNTYRCVFGESLYFDQQEYESILKTRAWIDEIALQDPLLANLVTVAALSSLVPASKMTRAGDLRFKTPEELQSESISFQNAIKQKLFEMTGDIRDDINGLKTEPILISEASQSLSKIPALGIDAVVTSPPYVNGTNYFRNTKIELWFLRCLNDQSDLARYRAAALTSGINDVTVANSLLCSNQDVQKIVAALEKKSYDSRIPRMISTYFAELTSVFRSVTRHLTSGAIVAIDIGDSAYNGVHVPVDHLLISCLCEIDFQQTDYVVLRQRRSRGGMLLKQVLLVFQYKPANGVSSLHNPDVTWESRWAHFKEKLPHQAMPFVKRNWGHGRHSLCSYMGKLKPAIAHNLVSTFVPENGTILDPFAGVGTISFEAALQGKHSYGFDINPAALTITTAKIQSPNPLLCFEVVDRLQEFINNHQVWAEELDQAKTFGFNGKLVEFYEQSTLKEILLARRFFQLNPCKNVESHFVLACLLHVLHGNRPYSLSRRSHPITPYKPTGDFEYKSLIQKVTDKITRSLNQDLPAEFVPGKMFLQDTAKWWPLEVEQLDAIITSPPFFDSTRFYLANWLRLWFVGWSPRDFETQPLGFIDERQKKSFEVYTPILRQARERLKSGGVVVLHLGKSEKCDMAAELLKVSRRWFNSYDLFDESVAHCESHGIRDKGTVTSHQYLVLY